MNILYDKEFEVSKVNFDKIKKKYSGFIAFRTIDNKYFIKVWFMKIANEIKEIIN